VTSAEVVARLVRRGETLATAESLTAGQLAGSVADVPGASAVLRGGLIVYAVDLKASLAGVNEQLLAEHGPVHPEVARQLATGARERCGATWGLATTGVAGPQSHGGHPAGTVYVGLAGPAVLLAERLALPGDRAAVRAGSVAAALGLLLRSLPAA
jgi:nicotinamide-nucleotide amidase